jgi:hypothetical protein
MQRTQIDVERLRHDVFLRMLDAAAVSPQKLDDQAAALLGEHAARVVKAAMEGMQYFDRTGAVRDPHPETRSRPSRP